MFEYVQYGMELISNSHHKFDQKGTQEESGDIPEKVIPETLNFFKNGHSCIFTIFRI